MGHSKKDVENTSGMVAVGSLSRVKQRAQSRTKHCRALTKSSSLGLESRQDVQKVYFKFIPKSLAHKMLV